MTATELVKRLSDDVGVEVTLGRLYRYEERGIVPPPMRDKEGRKVYSEECYSRMLKTVLLSEMGFFISVIRSYNLGSTVLAKGVQLRLKQLVAVITKAKTIEW